MLGITLQTPFGKINMMLSSCFQIIKQQLNNKKESATTTITITITITTSTTTTTTATRK